MAATARRGRTGRPCSRGDRVTLAIAKNVSGNSKIGDAATTYAAQPSCPLSCPFLDGGGCYAETGRIGMFVTRPLNEAAARSGATAVTVALAEAEAIDLLIPVGGRPLRLHSVGDCSTDQAARTVSAAAERYMQRGGGPVWTYTHAWRDVDRASWGDVSVLASCETPADVLLAHARGYATAVVVEEFESDRKYSGSIPESAVLPCPQMTRGVACSDCRLCMDDAGLRERGCSIGFEIHGIPLTVRRARAALRAPGDPGRRLSAEDQLRALLKEQPLISAKGAAALLDMNAGYAGQLLAFLRGHAEHPSVLRRRRHDRHKKQLKVAA